MGHRYRICGLTIASDIEIPGAREGDPSGEPDVRIAAGPTPPHLEAPLEAGPNWQRTQDQLLLRVPRVARFLMRGGARIDYQAEAEATPQDVCALLMAPALGILLLQRGLVTLRASSVALDGRAVLFVGGSGAGKSTLAAALAGRGMPFVADDICVLGSGADGTPQAHPDVGLARLWTEAIQQLGLGDRQGAAVRPAIRKHHVRPPAATAAGPFPVGAVYVLREALAPARPGLERLNFVDATSALRTAAYRTGLVEGLGLAPAFFRAGAAVAGAAGVHLLTRMLLYERLPDLLDGLDAHWRGRAWPTD